MKRTRLNRRRYAEVVTLLKGIVTDQKQPVERRMRAADRLMDLYDRNDKLAERLARRERIDSLDSDAEETSAATSTESDAVSEPELSAEEAAARFLASVRAQREGVANNA